MVARIFSAHGRSRSGRNGHWLLGGVPTSWCAVPVDLIVAAHLMLFAQDTTRVSALSSVTPYATRYGSDVVAQRMIAPRRLQADLERRPLAATPGQDATHLIVEVALHFKDEARMPCR